MKNLVKIISFVFAIVLFTNLFTSCKKDADLPTPENKTETPTTNTPNGEVTNAQISMLKTLTEVDETETDTMNLCDCFDLFSGVNWEATDEEIAAQLESILNGLTGEEIEALLTPVCTTDGEFFPNACIAECNGVTNYEVCDDNVGGFEDCFTFEYPITVVFPDNTTTAVNSDEELIATVENWYDANPDVVEDPTLVYPVNAILVGSGETVTVSSDDELEALFDICDDDGEEDCFAFVFPLTIQFPDGTTAVINNMEEGEMIVDAWYDANPNSMEDPTFVFPIQVTLEDGTVQTINNEEELDALFEDCYGMGGCFLMDDSSNALTAGIAKMKKN